MQTCVVLCLLRNQSCSFWRDQVWAFKVLLRVLHCYFTSQTLSYRDISERGVLHLGKALKKAFFSGRVGACVPGETPWWNKQWMEGQGDSTGVGLTKVIKTWDFGDILHDFVCLTAGWVTSHKVGERARCAYLTIWVEQRRTFFELFTNISSVRLTFWNRFMFSSDYPSVTNIPRALCTRVRALVFVKKQMEEVIDDGFKRYIW